MNTNFWKFRYVCILRNNGLFRKKRFLFELWPNKVCLSFVFVIFDNPPPSFFEQLFNKMRVIPLSNSNFKCFSFRVLYQFLRKTIEFSIFSNRIQIRFYSNIDKCFAFTFRKCWPSFYDSIFWYFFKFLNKFILRVVKVKCSHSDPEVRKWSIFSESKWRYFFMWSLQIQAHEIETTDFIHMKKRTISLLLKVLLGRKANFLPTKTVLDPPMLITRFLHVEDTHVDRCYGFNRVLFQDIRVCH